MKNILRHEYFFEEPLLPKLFLQSWKMEDGGQRGLILITHGIAEHSECYDNLATHLARENWTVFGWDLEGHGKSAGQRGYIENFSHYVRDLRCVIEELRKSENVKSSPLILFGHSMGGLITLRLLLEDKLPPIHGCVLSSPALGIAIPVPAIKDAAARWIHRLWPTLTLDSEINFSYLSRDTEFVKGYKKDPLRHSKVAAAVYLGMLGNMEYIKNNIDRLKTPLLFQLAGLDKIVDTNESITLFKDISSEKQIHIYEDSFHEIYNDLNKQEVIDHLHAFLADLKL